ncbi:MAG: sugar transferase [Clostridia bacterium]|nr:sugar transferase [Clostridia bacterium]
MNAVKKTPEPALSAQEIRENGPSALPEGREGFVAAPLTRRQRSALGIELYYRPFRLGSDALQKRPYHIVKRGMDVVLSLFALLILWPVLAVFMLAVVIEDPHGSPIFLQKRIGKDGRPFMMYKLRSMYVDAEDQLSDIMEQNEALGKAFKIKNDPRVTKVGRIARKFCVDELFQLVNILKADMSIVGPRPPLPREVEQYDEYDMQRLSMRPGLTCFWQVYPRRHEVSFEDWVAMDIKYLITHSLKVDLELILRTFLTIFTGKGD